jgi:hypothetical protein
MQDGTVAPSGHSAFKAAEKRFKRCSERDPCYRSRVTNWVACSYRTTGVSAEALRDAIDFHSPERNTADHIARIERALTLRRSSVCLPCVPPCAQRSVLPAAHEGHAGVWRIKDRPGLFVIPNGLSVREQVGPIGDAVT